MTAPDWPRDLDRHEAEIEADCVPAPNCIDPPFPPDAWVVERAHPEYGRAILTRCWWTHGHWRVEVMHGKSTTGAPADHFVLAPEEWADPPARPLSAVDLLELSTDGPLTAAQYAEARRADAERLAERIAWLTTMAEWWATIGALINPGHAAQQAAGFRRIAKTLAEEAGS